MRKIYITMAFLGCLSFMNAQDTHEVGNTGFVFNPDTIHLISGDFIHFTSTGSHSMTEVDEATWMSDGNTSNGGFNTGVISNTDATFEVTGSGTIYFVCIPHAGLGMKGVIIVDTANSIEEAAQADFSVYPNPVVSDLNLNISSDFEGQIQIVDLSGKVRMTQNVNGISKVDMSTVSAGLYFVRLLNSRGMVEKTVRVVKK